MIRHIRKYGWVTVLSLMLVLLYGCDVGINPLLFDGSPLEAILTVTSTETSFMQSGEVNLSDAASDISQDIDSVKVFNVTIRVENTGGTAPLTTFSGNATFDGNTVATLTNVPLSTLANETSIFNTTGISFNGTGVHALATAINAAVSQHDGTLHSFSVTMTASESPVNIKIHVKVYTQVYTPAPNK